MEHHHTVTLRVLHAIREHRGANVAFIGMAQQLLEIVTVENVVADDEGLGQAAGTGLHRIWHVHAPLAAITQQLLKVWRVLRGADEDVAEAAEHRGVQGIDYRLVLYGQLLLVNRERGRVQSSAEASGEDDAFALRHILFQCLEERTLRFSDRAEGTAAREIRKSRITRCLPFTAGQAEQVNIGEWRPDKSLSQSMAPSSKTLKASG